MSEQDEMTMPLLAATTIDGAVFIAGQVPDYGNCVNADAWKSAFGEEGKTEVNALFDNQDHIIVEILTEMGLSKKELKIGAKMVSVIRIPMNRIHFVKAGYLKGIPSPTEEISDTEQ